jgi:hypothetical protein
MNGPEEELDNKFPDAELAAFERQLMQAMRRVDAPENFAAAVMRRADADKPGARIIAMPVRWSASRNSWLGGAIAALLVLGIGGGEALHMHREREAERTRQQFEAAMRITDQALDRAQAQLARAGIRLGN